MDWWRESPLPRNGAHLDSLAPYPSKIARWRSSNDDAVVLQNPGANWSTQLPAWVVFLMVGAAVSGRSFTL